MGLDNGVILNKPTGATPSHISVEICYWRKCWGIRNEILCLFPETEPNDSCLDLTPEHIRAIRRILRSFMNQNKWEEEGDSIWSYSTIRPRLTKHWSALWKLEKYMRKNPDAKAYFYDSW